MSRKKTILIHSNFCRALTGFGKNKKNILKYLVNTGKYNIVEAANGKQENDPVLSRLPWECHGTIPNNFPALSEQDKRLAGYGHFCIDEVIKKVKPDIYLGIEDIWAFRDYDKRPWWNKINTMIWTTLDSLPILPQAIDFAPKTKHYYVWASFAERAMQQLGYNHIKTLRGSLDCSKFFKLPDKDRSFLRNKFKIDDDAFIIGFVFRNQLRKSVPNLLDGFKKFKTRNPQAKVKLLLHTHWSEGWDIPAFLKEKEINPQDVLTTYYCSVCGEYFINPFIGQEKKCPCCEHPKSLNTTNITHGVSDAQLNEIYNLMDVYCHPFTSGGQEIPIQEAKLTELITLVTNYSCGEDSCTTESAGLALDWHEYREPGTQFIKASTSSDSIVEALEEVFFMNLEAKDQMGKQARQWVIDNFSIEVVGKQLENIFDAMPLVDYDFSLQPIKHNDRYVPPQNLNGLELIIDLYQNILHDTVDQHSTGVKIWLDRLSSGEITPQNLVLHFQNVARQENQKNQKIEFDSLFKDEENSQRIAVVVPDSSTDVFVINSLMSGLKEKYPQHNIYVFTDPKHFELIEDNPCVHKCLPFSPSLDNPVLLEGIGDHSGYFDLAFYPTTTTQKFSCYIHNGHDHV